MGLTQVLKNALVDEDQNVALFAVDVLGLVGTPEVAQLFTSVFWGQPLTVQRAMILTLVPLAGQESVAFFTDLLARHTDGKVLKSAAAFLGEKLKHAPAANALFSLLDHQYDDVKEAALDACVAIGGADMQERFQQLFHGIDPLKRLMAVYALGKIDPSGNLEILKAGLEDESPEIRKHSLEAISNICFESDMWVPLLGSRLLDENRDVRQTVVEIMGKCFSPAILPLLVQALQDDDDWVKVRALEAIGQHRIKEAIPEVVAQLENPNKLVAIRAIECLGSIGGTASFQALLSISDSEDFEIMEAAEAAIARIQDEQEREI
jgi:HEAT repeat protein